MKRLGKNRLALFLVLGLLAGLLTSLFIARIYQINGVNADGAILPGVRLQVRQDPRAVVCPGVLGVKQMGYPYVVFSPLDGKDYGCELATRSDWTFFYPMSFLANELIGLGVGLGAYGVYRIIQRRKL